MKAYYRGPDGLPHQTGDISENSNFLYHPVRDRTSTDLRIAKIDPCCIPMEGTCPHGWTLSRLPLAPILPAPLGPVNLLGETMREDFRAALDQFAGWASDRIERYGLGAQPKSVLIQGHTRLLRFLADGLYNSTSPRMSLETAIRYCLAGTFNATSKIEPVRIDPAEGGIYELRLISEESLLPSILFKL
jgi:hypothetical protein